MPQNEMKELAVALLDLEDWWGRPTESFPPHPYGEPMYGRLQVYGPVTKENIRSAVRLTGMLGYEKLRRFERAWAKLPARRRREVEAEIRLIRVERAAAALCAAVERLERLCSS
jgi:hypothetical protein